MVAVSVSDSTVAGAGLSSGFGAVPEGSRPSVQLGGSLAGNDSASISSIQASSTPSFRCALDVAMTTSMPPSAASARRKSFWGLGCS
jgi:hypothetical protein